jgi:TolB-like protein/DNA-binding winged helix-turn-helix (wHTH) protein/Tfp pilus assembly protein PilF
MEEPGSLYEFPPFCLDPIKQVLWRNGERLALTQKAFATLVVLVEQHGRTVDKEELVDQVWHGVAVEENNLSQCISALRKALGERHNEHRFILTVPGRGYRFVAEVRRSAAGSAAKIEEGGPGYPGAEFRGVGGAEVQAAGVAQPAKAPTPDNERYEKIERNREQRRMKRWVLVASVAGVLIALGIVGLSRVLKSRGQKQTVGPVPASVAVLPFLNLDGDSTKDYLSDGLTEELTTALAEVRGLRVVARTSAFQFRDKGEDVRRIGEQLGVGAVLEGSVSRSGDRFHITAQLVSTQNGYHLWSGIYDGQLSQMYTIQEKIVDQTARTLGIAANAHAPSSAHRQTKNPEAHDLYLEGRYFWNKRDLRDMQRSIQLFEAAIQKDPNFALAYAGLADTYVVLGGNGQEPLAETVPRAKAALARALELDPDLAEAHTTLALLNSESSGDPRGLEGDLRKAIELSPGYARAHHWLGVILTGKGQFEEADAELRQAQILDPLSPMISEGVAENFYSWRRYDDVIEQAERVRKMGSNIADDIMGLAYIEKGMYQEAIGVYSDLLRADRTPRSLTNLAIAYAAAGQKQEARRLLSQANALRVGYVPPYRIALVYINLGEKETAFRWLQRACQQNDPLRGGMKVDPMLDPIRSDQRYAELLGEAGLND